jgi:hypothetical protein
MIFTTIVLGLVIAVVCGFVGAGLGAFVWLCLGCPDLDDE